MTSTLRRHRPRCWRSWRPFIPRPDKLLPAFQNTFSSLISYIREHHIITIPSDVEPTLEETPPFDAGDDLCVDGSSGTV